MDEEDISFTVKEIIKSKLGSVLIFNIQKLRDLNLGDPNKLPYSHRILLENLLRNLDSERVKKEHLLSVCQWDSKSDLINEFFFFQDALSINGIETFLKAESALTNNL